MSKKDNGGPAFPSEGKGHGNPQYHSPGMSLRDWFAGHVVSRLIALTAEGIMKPVGDDDGNVDGELAKAAYSIADAMLKERKK